MPKAKARPAVTQRGREITIEANGYEFRAEDLEWLNLHRGILKRLKKAVKLTFLTVPSARQAFEEMIELGAANVYSVPGMTFTDDTVAGLVARLLGEKGKAPRKGG